MAPEGGTDRRAEERLSVGTRRQDGRVFDPGREPDGDGPRPEGRLQAGRGLAARVVVVEDQVQARPSAEEAEDDVGQRSPAESQPGHAPGAERQQVGRALHDAHAAEIAVGRLPARRGFRPGSPR